MTNTATRLITLIFLLQNQPNQEASELAEKLDVSIRTVHRYFEMLAEMGIPVYSERGPSGGFSLVRGYKMPPLVFSRAEFPEHVEALVLVSPANMLVMALEGLLWITEGIFDNTVKDNWAYTLMIMQPDIITAEPFEEARDQVCQRKGNSDSLNKVRLAHFEEALCVQTMHIGPYATEPATIARMKTYIQ